MRQLHKTVLPFAVSERLPAMLKVCLPILILVFSGASGQGDDEIPTGFKVDRYQKVWERNPFTLVTPVVQQAQPTVFDKLALVSWMKAGSKDVVLVQNTDNNEVQKVTVEPNANNLRLIELRPNQNPQMVEAVLSDGKEQGSVKFKMDAVPVAQPGSQPTVPVAAAGPVSPQNPMQYPPVQLPNGMAPQNGAPQNGAQQNGAQQNGAPQLPRPIQATRQQGSENGMQTMPTQPMPGSTPFHPGEIRRKRLAPPNTN